MMRRKVKGLVGAVLLWPLVMVEVGALWLWLKMGEDAIRAVRRTEDAEGER